MSTIKSIYLSIMLGLIFVNCNKASDDKIVIDEAQALLNPMDAVLVAPDSHELLIDNEKVRVLKVTLTSGEKEPLHNHEWESIMIVAHPSRIKYYTDKEVLVFESDKESFSYSPREPQGMEAQGIHAVENIDTTEFSAIRIELKQ